MGERDARKFDPARASMLDAAERDAYLPDGLVADLLELTGADHRLRARRQDQIRLPLR